MTDEQAKEIAALLQAELDGHIKVLPEMAGNHDVMVTALLLKLYDDIQAIKSSMSGLSFMSAGIKPMTRVDQ